MESHEQRWSIYTQNIAQRRTFRNSNIKDLLGFYHCHKSSLTLTLYTVKQIRQRFWLFFSCLFLCVRVLRVFSSSSFYYKAIWKFHCYNDSDRGEAFLLQFVCILTHFYYIFIIIIMVCDVISCWLFPCLSCLCHSIRLLLLKVPWKTVWLQMRRRCYEFPSFQKGARLIRAFFSTQIREQFCLLATF